MTNAERGGIGANGVALAFGLVIMVMVYATGHVSGAHINPAVTIAFATRRHFPVRETVAYVPAQIVGAVCGALLLRLAWHGTPADLGATVPTVGTATAFAYEFTLTALLMFVIMAVATDTRAVGEAAAIAIGGTVGLDAMFGGPITGASMNPARSLGPAIAASDYTAIWVYLAAPLAGGALAAVVYQLLRVETPQTVSEPQPREPA